MVTARLLTLLLACALAGCGGGEQPATTAPPGEPPLVCVDADAPVASPEAFDGLTGGESLGELVWRLGPAHAEVGSGLYALVWRGADAREYRASVPDLAASTQPHGRGFAAQ